MRKTAQSVETSPERKRNQWTTLYLLNVVAIALSVAILSGFLIVSVLQAFSESSTVGLRTLAAIALPPIAITYMVFFTKLLKPPQNVPPFNLYFVFTVWTTAVLILSGDYMKMNFPAGEFALSITLTLLAVQWRNQPLQGFISCCYGIISGFLLYVLLWGLPS